jgi:hypothetical protein
MDKEINEVHEWKIEKPGDIFIFGIKGCLEENTEIIINERGEFRNEKIKDLPYKFSVVSYNFKRKDFLVNDIATKEFLGEKECFKITFRNGKSLLATKEHRFFNENNRKISVSNMVVGDKLLFLDEKISFNEVYHKLNFLKIDSIVNVGKKNVFDISVAENHNFLLSNGILSHNSGKSCKLLTMAQAMKDNKIVNKVWDSFGGDRDEGPFWCFPNRDLNLWNDLETETFEFETEGPKQYQITYAVPLFSKTLSDKLPEDMPNVETEVFTIPFRKIEKKHLACVVGEVGKNAETLWEDILENTNKNSNGSDIEYLMNTKFKNHKKSSFYKLFLKPMIDNHFFGSENCELNLDVLKECEKKERVFVLCLDDVPLQFKLFVMSYLITEVYRLIKKNLTYKDHLVLFREASLFMKQIDSDKNREGQCNAFRNILVDMVRYGRTGMYFGLDTQDSAECRGLIDGNQEILAMCELPSQNSIETTCLPLKKAGRMNDAQIAYIQWKIQKHQICIVQRGKRAVILKRINPPRSMYWKPEYRNFIAFWKKEKDKWVETKKFLDKIKEEYKERRDYLTIVNQSNEEEFLENPKSEEEDFDEDESKDDEYKDNYSNKELIIKEKEEEIGEDEFLPSVDIDNIDEVNNAKENQMAEEKKESLDNFNKEVVF